MICRNKNIRVVVLIACFGLAVNVSYAQQNNLKEILERISNTYDTLKNFAADIRFVYSSDTIAAGKGPETMTGSYILNGNKAFYKLLDMEYMQNDSFFIAVYNRERHIMVSPNRGNIASFFPVKEMMDSVLKLSAKYYAVTTTADKKTKLGKINFTAKEKGPQVKEYIIEYDTHTNWIKAIRYVYDKNITAGDGVQRVSKNESNFSIEFVNGRVINSKANIYDEKNYIMPGKDGFIPVSKYEGYKVFYSKPMDIKDAK